MIIKGIKYIRYPEMSREWRVMGNKNGTDDGYVYFDNLNLLVGKNASGKSRTLSAVRELATLVSGRKLVKDTTYHTQRFDFLFDDEGTEYRYVLYFKEKEILEEILYIDKVEVLNREKKFISLLGEKEIVVSDFDESQLLICKKRHDGGYYFEHLVFWGISLRTFMFSDQVEKNKYIEDIHVLDVNDQDVENLGVIIPVFHWGRKEYGQRFEDEILECMNEIGYRLTDIDIKQGKRGYCINVEENGKYMVSQQEMSQGMFRALALFVLLINARWRKLSVCILVDDVGEGLDHERAKGFIDLVIKKTFNTQIQYFMSSNDRYVMNQIHLKYWTVIERKNADSIFYNIFNSRKNFEDFRYTGLNNFDFFTTDFYRDGFGEDDSNNEESNL